jgi:hypothetical protein
VIGHRTFLADQLVEPVICHDSIALCIGIDTVSRPWSLASIVTRQRIDLPCAGTKNKMQVTGMKPEDDLASNSLEYSGVPLIEPLP